MFHVLLPVACLFTPLSGSSSTWRSLFFPLRSTFLTSLVKNDRVSLFFRVNPIDKLVLVRLTCRCEEFLQSMSPIRGSRTVSGGSMSGDWFLHCHSIRWNHSEEEIFQTCGWGFCRFFSRGEKPGWYQTTGWIPECLDPHSFDPWYCHRRSRSVCFCDIFIVASFRPRVINFPDNLIRQRRRTAPSGAKKSGFWGTWSGGWGGPPIAIAQSWNFLEKCFFQVFFWNLALCPCPNRAIFRGSGVWAARMGLWKPSW